MANRVTWPAWVGPLALVLSIVSSTVAEEAGPKATGWLGEVDVYAKVFGGVLTALGAVFGLPITILHFRKTRAEIRKLELEAQALATKGSESDKGAGVYDIRIEGHDNMVQILADPRFLGPLLLLLDFILAWIILTLAGYALGMFLPGLIRGFVLLVLAAILLIPIFREARRVRGVLRPKEDANARGAI